MSILIIGVGGAGATFADKINQLKIPGVNCALVVDGWSRYASTSIDYGVDISNNDPINSGSNPEYQKKIAEDKLELIKTLILEGTSKNWSKEDE